MEVYINQNSLYLLLLFKNNHFHINNLDFIFINIMINLSLHIF